MLLKSWLYFGDMLRGFVTNEHIRIAFLAMITAQILKIFFYLLKHHRWNFRIIFQSSGMPSSHSAMVMALTASVGIRQGWGSAAFAIAVVFASIVMYDAAGVRQAAGKQARILNMMMEDFFNKKTISELRLKELLGHTKFEVLVGCLLGAFIAFFYHLAYRL